jgi:OOP family OmpA-OmpF porin
MFSSPTLLFAAASVLASGCSMTTAVLHEQTPVQVAATRPPAPEPEPEPEPSRVVVEAERIRVDEKILFEIASDEISSESDGLLREIAQVMNENPHVRKVRVEGHTDNQGAAAYNLDLSRRRARAVRERLIANGVEEGRLESQGYGLTRPLETNDTDAGRAANRRVEFNILEQDATTEAPAGGAPQVAAPAAPEANPRAPGPTVRTGGGAR